MGPVFTEEEEEFLKDHRFSVLATGRQDGSPQVSLVAYHWDGTNILIILTKHSAKWKNAVRQSNIALVIHDEFAQLAVYGTVECIDQDPLRAELTATTRNYYSTLPKSAFAGRSFEVNAEFIAELDQEGFVILRITPTKVLGVLLDY
jgi:PPOX class probable F420-dependent enzyme